VTSGGGKLRIWTLGDGRIGIDNQVTGLAEAIARKIPAEITHFIARKPGLFSFFFKAKPLPDMTSPWPDIVIGCGRASLQYSRQFRKWSNGNSFVVQLQDPGTGLRAFDLVIAPKHDQLSGEKVFSITGATNRITTRKLKKAKKKFGEKLQSLPKPKLAILLGGKSKRHVLTRPKFRKLLKQLRKLADNKISLLITTSRRTPAFAKRSLRRRLGKLDNVWLWSGARKDGENPYLAFLAEADAILVSSDSTNMLTDAASAGKPVLLFKMDGKDGKFSDLYADLENGNHLHPFTGALATWEVEPLAETNRAANEVLRRFHKQLTAKAAPK
jgi:mitochondrial fission protein ELM1